MPRVPIRSLLAASLATAALGSAQAARLSAECKAPQGTFFHVPKGKTQPVQEKSGYRNSTWTLVWDSARPEQGTIRHTSTDPARPAGEQPADVIDARPSLITFLVPDGPEIMVYSLYPTQGLLLASLHGPSNARDDATGGTFTARCTVSETR
ncbi:hypothetical protein CEG14_04170 [Bordetella genomosp. 1]|uniref:Uncharacterized protein n=1 Tax=Bordetella genomosp. 1 TaxID=1395607 RepID=A0A261SU97_9BORD|nr:hypothetical protein [Bordetella genomosp. 1]OZI40949.1 hypothetical protein CEG14_04170 [Bordetella genomosp. 1]